MLRSCCEVKYITVTALTVLPVLRALPGTVYMKVLCLCLNAPMDRRQPPKSGAVLQQVASFCCKWTRDLDVNPFVFEGKHYGRGIVSSTSPHSLHTSLFTACVSAALALPGGLSGTDYCNSATALICKPSCENKVYMRQPY